LSAVTVGGSYGRDKKVAENVCYSVVVYVMRRQGKMTRADDRYGEKREMAAIHGTARYA
jgi:hypothetical protein